MLCNQVVNRTLMHEGNEVREFYSQLPRPVLVAIEAIGPMQWFLDQLQELGIECQVGEATKPWTAAMEAAMFTGNQAFHEGQP